MLCDRVLGQIADPPPAGAIALPLTWRECRARATRKTLPDGRTVRIVLPPGLLLKHRDILHDRPGAVIYVDLQPSEVLVAPAEDWRVVYALGNLHLPLQIQDGQIITPLDGPALAIFRDLGLPTDTQRRRFDPLPLPNGLAFRLSDDCAVGGG